MQTYFKKKRAFAGNIAYCGVGVGVLSLAPIITLLENKFGWSYTMMILGALMLACTPLGMTFRPLAASNSERPEIKAEENMAANHDGADVTDESGKINLIKLIFQKIPKPPKVLCSPVFITCLVAHISMNIGYSVPYVYTIVSMKFQFMYRDRQKGGAVC